MPQMAPCEPGRALMRPLLRLSVTNARAYEQAGAGAARGRVLRSWDASERGGGRTSWWRVCVQPQPLRARRRPSRLHRPGGRGVYAVGQKGFSVRRYGLAEWIGGADESQAQVIEADDATMAPELLNLVREDCLLWQCGSCADGTRGWIYTGNRHGSRVCAARRPRGWCGLPTRDATRRSALGGPDAP